MLAKEILKKLRLTSLRSQLILGITIVNVVLMFSFGLQMINRQKNFFLKLNHDQAIGLSINLASTANTYIISYELARLQKLVASYKEIPNLQYAIVTSDDGTVLAHTDKKYLGLKATDTVSAKLKPLNTTQILLEDDNVLDVASPITNHNEIVGWARIGISQKYINPNITEIRQKALLYIIISLIVAILFAIIISAGLSRGLQKLVTAAEKIKAGNRDVRVGSSGSEEISQLGTAFDQMLDEISSNERLLTMVLDNLPVGVWVLDEKGNILSVNPAGKEMWKGIRYVGTEDYNQYKAWFTETDKEVENHQWGAAISLAEGKPVLNQEIEIECFDKSHKIILNSSIPLKDANKKIVGAITINVDITSRKEAETKTKQRESQLTAFFENAEGSASLLDTNKKYLLFNAKFVEDHKLLSGHTPYVGEEVYDFLPPELKNARHEMLDRVLKGIKEVVEVDYIRNGNRVCFRSSFNPVITDGIVTGISTYSIDLTASKEAEVKIRESEEKFRYAFMTGMDGYYIASMDEGRLIEANDVFYNIFGYTREECEGKTFADLNIYHDPNDRIRMIAALKEHGQVQDLEATGRQKDGTLILVSLSTSICNMGGKNFILGAVRDITEQKKTQLALAQSDERNRALIENISDTIILVNTNLEIIYQSPSFKRTGGFSIDELQNKTILELIHTDDLNMCRILIKEVLSSPGSPIPFELRILHKNGGFIWIEGSITNLLNNESVNAIVINFRNITERKNAQDEMKEMNGRLRLLSSHLQSIREEERTSIAREIHDELGQQLTGLKMDVMSLKKKYERTLPETVQQAEDMMKLIDNTIQTVRRIATELRPGVLDDLGLAAAIEWQAGEFEKRTGIECTVDTKDASENYEKDISTAVFRIFQESLTNVTRHAQAKKVESRLVEQGDMLILEIKDNGKGISEERKNNKTSLGLLGMKERALILNGSFSIQNLPENGTCVTLQLPITKHPNAELS